MDNALKNDPEVEVKNTLSEKCKGIKTFEELTAFLNDVAENYNVGYGSCVVAIGQAALATANYLAGKFGITGFQASYVTWEFIDGWTDIGKEVGAKILDYDKMLYPRYGYIFEKTISKSCWEALQKKAKEKLEKDQYLTHPVVIEHWQSIADGNIPFGYVLKDD